jgi:hypothetical protein
MPIAENGIVAKNPVQHTARPERPWSARRQAMTRSQPLLPAAQTQDTGGSLWRYGVWPQRRARGGTAPTGPPHARWAWPCAHGVSGPIVVSSRENRLTSGPPYG